MIRNLGYVFFYEFWKKKKTLKFKFYQFSSYVWIIVKVTILVENFAGMIIVQCWIKLNDVRMFTIESVKKTNVPLGLHWNGSRYRNYWNIKTIMYIKRYIFLLEKKGLIFFGPIFPNKNVYGFIYIYIFA